MYTAADISVHSSSLNPDRLAQRLTVSEPCLPPEDVQTAPGRRLTKRFEYSPEILGSLSRLASLGLVTEKFLRPDPNTIDEQKLSSLLKFGAWRTFQLPSLGQRFLRFVAAQERPQSDSSPV
jgi:hypothetical protein